MAISSPMTVVVNKLKAGRGNRIMRRSRRTEHYDANSREKPSEPSQAQKIPKYRTQGFVKGKKSEDYP